MSATDVLLASALVGTARRPCVLAPDDEPLLAGVLPTGTLSPADLLHAAGAVALAGRATNRDRRRVAPVTSLAEFRAHEGPETTDLPEASSVATSRLAALLAQPLNQDTLWGLGVWLDTCRQAGRQVPAHLVPGLLDVAARNRALRAPALAVAGRVAPWLAQAAAGRWTWVTRDAVGEERTAGLAATALAALLELVDLEILEARVDGGVTEADEPALEKALRSARTRKAAATLLRRLPGSAYTARMRVRLAACLAVGPDGLTVTLPSELPADAVRDGLVRKAPARRGERAWWFEQLVGAVPMAAWSDLAPDPAVLLDATSNLDVAAELVRGLAVAAQDQEHAGLARSLIGRGEIGIQGREALAALLDPADRAQAALTLLVDDQMLVAAAVLRALPHPWPREVEEEVFASLLRSPSRRWETAVGDVAGTLLDPSWLPRLTAEAARSASATKGRKGTVRPDHSRTALDRAIELITIRRDTFAELNDLKESR
ncbi:hypothetical protein APR04_004587 [Promicromonospora umidemergens]|uniref:DUF5691 domain-containing protein n=1 Tax=Promicromonospora umidemergens TaxID=629679 RepID=A0ABP8XIE4_9MICO|nr:DUF5691 domain-containing protein [Promicromonospora umidemergens]MCP2285652.1 hypothetical protein [Promicromonospora umidemergens]